MIRITGFTLLIFLCITAINAQEGSAADSSRIILGTDSFEIAATDYQKGSLRHVFIVMEPDKAMDTALVRGVICALKTKWAANQSPGISFFSEKRYAGYKDALFFEKDHTLPLAAYPDWMEDYYLGTYDSVKGVYTTYPGSYSFGKQKRYKLKNCF